MCWRSCFGILICSVSLAFGWVACQPLFQCTQANHCPTDQVCIEQQCQARTEPTPGDAAPTEAPNDTTPDKSPTDKAPIDQVCQKQFESCNGRDDDCDGLVDEETCSANQVCFKGKCVAFSGKFCAKNEDCPTGESCAGAQVVGAGICATTCTSDQDCPDLLACMLTVCSAESQCKTDAHCGEDRRCDNGSCFAKTPQCREDSDCATKNCVIGTCMPFDKR